MHNRLEVFDRLDEVRLTRISGARIISLSGHAIAACTVTNLSASGAVLRSVSCGGLERGFGLLVDGEEKVRGCEIAWQLAHQMGVRFVTIGRAGLIDGPIAQGPSSVWPEQAYLRNW